MEENDVADWLYKQVMPKLGKTSDMGDMEKVLARVSNDVCYKALEQMTREVAGKQDFVCSKCNEKLYVIDKDRKRTIRSFSFLIFNSIISDGQ